MEKEGNARGPLKVEGDQLGREASEQVRRAGSSSVLCRDLMKKDVVAVSPAVSVQEAARLMRDQEIGFLPVCESGGKVVGAITDRDITIRVSADGRDVRECLVRDAMTREVIACRPEDQVSRAEELMGCMQKSRMVVTDENDRLQGVISLSDIAEREAQWRAGQVLREVAQREVRS